MAFTNRVAASARALSAARPALKRSTSGNTMPPGFQAKVAQLDTFIVPETVSGTTADQTMGKNIVQALQRDGIFQVKMTPLQEILYQNAAAASRGFFARPHDQKAACVDPHSYSGYVASGEEITDGIADYSEIFTVTPDLPAKDKRVQQRWPCHGPVPWPDQDMKSSVDRYMRYLGKAGEKLLQLIELGLRVPKGSITDYTDDGWHHMRILRFPGKDNTNGKGKAGRGIGSHTDYGMLVMAAQDEVGGLFVRPPIQGEAHANWQRSAAGHNENDSKWTYVPPTPGVFTVFPGDMMQYMTNSVLPATPHKVGLNTRERFAFAYFHEPNFKSVVKPLPGYNKGQAPAEGIHYGTHFTNMCLRNYPDRITTKKLLAEDGCQILNSSELKAEYS
ncbi:hypothetical protein G7046_g4400 [Stylonectria norvegica]|nr:hypothetical protein G7046_g4400 [Stylonectria norvegica]